MAMLLRFSMLVVIYRKQICILRKAFQDIKVINKCKLQPRTGHESHDEQWYCSTLSLPTALDGVGGQRHAPAACPQQR